MYDCDAFKILSIGHPGVLEKEEYQDHVREIQSVKKEL
jgi:hypothetical protein